MKRLNADELELYSSENNFLNAFKTVLKNDEEFNQKGGKLSKTLKKRRKRIYT